MTPDRDYRRLIRTCVGFVVGTAAVCAVDAYVDSPWWKLAAAVAVCAVIVATCRGASACDQLDDYEAVHPMKSYRPLGLAEEWGYTTEDGAA